WRAGGLHSRRVALEGWQTDYCHLLDREEWRDFADCADAEPGRGRGYFAWTDPLRGDGIWGRVSARQEHTGTGTGADQHCTPQVSGRALRILRENQVAAAAFGGS